MKVGVVDLGTNSVRFAIYLLGEDERFTCTYKKKMMLRPGQGVFTGGRLKPATMKKITAAFTKFQRRTAKDQVSAIRAVATSALREAQNSRDLVRLVKRKTGIQIEIISGQQEARLIAKGILAHENLRRKNHSLIDIGGGSTEISLCRGRDILHSVSLNMGALRLQQIFLDDETQRSQALRLAGVDQMRKAIQLELHLHARAFCNKKINLVLGSSGTIRALARILDPRHAALGKKKIPLGQVAKPRLALSRTQLKHLIERMLVMSRSELKTIRGMEPRRVDIILGGAILLHEILEFLNASRLQTTNFSLRDGILEGFSRRKNA